MKGHSTGKRIGIDLDDVLLDLNPALCAYHNTRHGTNFTKEGVTDYDLWKMWNCTKEEFFERVDDFYDSPEHSDVNPISGAETAIRVLSEHHDLYVITAKPERLRGMTEEWINRHFPGMFRDIRFTGGYRRDDDGHVRKSDICREIGIRTFIDDALSNVEDLAPVMDQVFLLDSPWNRRDIPYVSVTRVFSWDDILHRLT
ncbi:MAG: hypothetical protein HGA31_03985 [Candidatus Moranbacteria bacterium]|nr:hypothetical protein [Candidatus Moranbacteria bacterium]